MKCNVISSNGLKIVFIGRHTKLSPFSKHFHSWPPPYLGHFNLFHFTRNLCKFWLQNSVQVHVHSISSPSLDEILETEEEIVLLPGNDQEISAEHWSIV